MQTVDGGSMQEAHCPGPGAGSGARSGASHGDEAEGTLGPTVAVLVVSLTIAAVGAYQLCGFGLHILNPRPRLFNNGFATAGVIVATMAAGAAVGNLVWLLSAARRRAALTGAGPGLGAAVTAGAATGTAAARTTAGAAASLAATGTATIAARTDAPAAGPTGDTPAAVGPPYGPEPDDPTTSRPEITRSAATPPTAGAPESGPQTTPKTNP